MKKTTLTKPQQQRMIEYYERKQSNAASVVQYFGTMNDAEAPAIDLVIAQRLNLALSSIDDNLSSACFLRGILPDRLCEAITMATFLSATLPLARAAQIVTGVPASLLIAEAFVLSRTEEDFSDINGKRFDVFHTGKSFASLKDAFLQRAYFLKTNAAFRRVMRSIGKKYQYLYEIQLWSKSQKKHIGDIVAETIRAHDLVKCDSMREMT